MSLDDCGTGGDDGDNNGGCGGDNGDGNATDNDWDEVGDMLCESSQPPACPENYEKKVIDSTKMLPFQECVETMKTVTVEVPATRKVAKCVKKPMEYFKKVLVKKRVPTKKTVMQDKVVPCKVWKQVDSTKTIQVPTEVDAWKDVFKYKNVKATKMVDTTVMVDEPYMKKVTKVVPVKKFMERDL